MNTLQHAPETPRNVESGANGHERAQWRPEEKKGDVDSWLLIQHFDVCTPPETKEPAPDFVALYVLTLKVPHSRLFAPIPRYISALVEQMRWRGHGSDGAVLAHVPLLIHVRPCIYRRRIVEIHV